MPPEADTLEKPITDATAEKVTTPAEGTKTGAADATAKGAAGDLGGDKKPVDAAKTGDDLTLDPDGDADLEEPDGDLADGDAKVADATKTADATKADGEADKDKGPAETPWSDVRKRAIDREIVRIEGQLAKKLTAADLPKELAKRRSALEKTLARYGSVEDALIAGYNAAEKIRTGAHKQPLPEDATDAEKAEWRKSNNIPEKAESYDIPKVAGHQWTEADAPVLDALKAEAFKNNWPQEVVSGITNFYAQVLENAKEGAETAMVERDRAGLETRRERRRELWGSEHKTHFTLMERALKDERAFPQGLGPALAQARLPDGTKLFDHPAFEPWLDQYALSTYGEGAMISGEQASAAASEKAELEALMASDIDAYHRNTWKGSGMTAEKRYTEILKKEEANKRR